MKKLIAISFLVALSTQTNGQRSTADSLDLKYLLVPLPLGSNDTLYNFAALHVAEYKKGESVYLDTTIANIFFSVLATKVDPQRVVLVTEEFNHNNRYDVIQKDSSYWMTPTIRNLGFNKYIPSDTRTDDVILHRSRLLYLSHFIVRYCSVAYSMDHKDYFGFPQRAIWYKDSIPESVSDSVVQALSAVVFDRYFEANLENVCKMLVAQGYIPVVVAGASHVMALPYNCMVQVSSERVEAFAQVRSIVNFITGENFILNTFYKRYNLEIIKKNK